MNYYELLEISPSASIEVIRNAYKTLAKKYHPDTYKGDGAFAEEKMKLLNEAISVLEDEGKRKEYNTINGLTQSGDYSEYGRANMLNVDENGESIFFSYGDAGDSDDFAMQGGDDASYMDIIDNFIKNSEPGKKSRKKAETEQWEGQSAETEPFENYPIDDRDEQEEFAASPQNHGEYGVDSADVDFESFSDEGEPKIVSDGKKNFDGNKIYWIVVAFLITGVIFCGAMIFRYIDFENIQQLFSAAKPKTEETTGETTDEISESAATIQDPSENEGQPTTAEVVFMTEETLDIESETEKESGETTEQTTEPTQIPTTSAKPTQTPTTSPPPLPATNPPATNPPATEPPTLPPTVTEAGEP